MKSILLALALAFFVAPTFSSLAQETAVSDLFSQTVLAAEQRWQDALIQSDTDALAALYDDTLIYTHSTGKVDSKTSYIAAIKSGATRYLSMDRSDIKVTLYDNAAVVTCHWKVQVASRGNKTDMDARYLHVYVKQKGGWKLAAHESTRIAQ
jgi:ketosteroid isomerase-like protein